MEFFDALQQIEQHPTFNEQGVLAHGFITKDKEWGDWYIGYYDKETDKITSYVLKEGTIEVLPPEEIFKKEGEVLEFNRKQRVASLIGLEKAIRAVFDEHYRGHTTKKIIVLLQRLPEGHVYNTTIVTNTFNLLNARFDSANNKLLSHDFSSLLSFGTPE